MNRYRFSVIIANYNGEKYLEDCLSSVFKTNYLNYELLIVEDGSTDSSLKVISRFQKNNEFKLIKNSKNLGLVASRNKAIRQAKGEILVFLDNDTQVDKNWLKGLDETFSQDKSIGAAQCKIFDFHKRNIIQEIGMKLIPHTGWGITLGRGEKDKGQFAKPVAIVALGAALAVKKNIARLIDGFDKEIYHYTDDLDFSWRVWISGYKIVLSPNAVIYHYTKAHNPSWRLYFHLSKNSFRMIIKNFELPNIIRFLPWSLAINFVGAVFVLIKRFSSASIFGFMFGVGWNVIHIKNTLNERGKVRKYRKMADKKIFNKIMIRDSIWNIYRKSL